MLKKQSKTSEKNGNVFEFCFPFPQLKRASNHRTSYFIGCTTEIEPPKGFLFDRKLKSAYSAIFCLHKAIVLLC